MPFYEITIAGLGPQPDQRAPDPETAARWAVMDATTGTLDVPEVWGPGERVDGVWSVTTREILPGSVAEDHVVERVVQVRVSVDWRVR